ncbi:hypothetical protein ACJZRZ_003920 [Vibrio parahaemolyticus]|uniref:hypothetical protein n=1 Tax=Vibrio harveyi group TaxID=717610 RepID=UPI0006A64162|nr:MULTISPECIES: hypothetical protein [Vibrio harveyi group]AYO10846.1 hypothetical protein D0784_16615 [Vibrio campbellii]EGQ7678503.1 hypothetical protein [Vibrio parahaemolyticus]EGQ9298337.1 hypothetical protein [Vibrio parahaemolyticus]EHE7897407.1 hypothetical protein [Vibrio parahaemolyticus]EHK2924393.1 hypothetical protein [Vibrio parahaemolyticus]
MLKEKLYLLNALLVPFIGITIHIKTKADTLTSIEGLRSKDVRKITGHASEFNRRIWMLWFIYFLAFCCSVIATLIPLSDIHTLSAVSFTISLFAVCFVASTSLYSTDQAIQILIVHLKAKALVNKERKSALEELRSDDEFSDNFKKYLSKQRGEDS